MTFVANVTDEQCSNCGGFLLTGQRCPNCAKKYSIEARAEALASEYFGPEFDGSHLTRKEAFVAGYKVCQQELDRQASDAVEKEWERIADELEAIDDSSDNPRAFDRKFFELIDQLRGQSK